MLRKITRKKSCLESGMRLAARIATVMFALCALTDRALADGTVNISSTTLVNFKGFGIFPAPYDRQTPTYNDGSTAWDQVSWLPASGATPGPVHQAVGNLGFEIARIYMTPTLSPSSGNLDSSRMQDLKDQIQIMKNMGITKYIISNWSPPAYMKTPDQVRWGTYNGHTEVLNGAYVNGSGWDYSDYIVAVLNNLKSAGYAAPIAISIQNEPDVSQIYDSCVYDDNSTDQNNYRSVIKELRSKLNSNGFSGVTLMGTEDSGFDGIKTILGTPTTGGFSNMNGDTAFRDALGAFDWHTYATSGVIKDIDAAMAFYGKDRWMTEYSESFGIRPELLTNSGNNQLDDAFTYTRRMGGDLVDLGANYWFFWRAYHSSSAYGNQDLVYDGPTLTKPYYVFQKLWQTVKGGWKVQQCSTTDPDMRTDNSSLINTYNGNEWSAPVDIVGFQAGDGSATCLMLDNWKGFAKNITGLTGLKGSTATIFTSTATQDMANTGTRAVSGGALQGGTLTLPAYSITFVITSGGAPTVPAAPTGLTASAGNTQAALSWNASSGATSYNISRSTISGSGYASVATGISTTTYTNTGLTNGTTYYFVASATNSAGTSGNSTQASATPIAPVQAQIIAGTATIDGTVETAWNAATAYSLSKTAGTISGASDCSGTWKGMWDATNLYILISVTDDVKTNDSTNPWDDDAAEIFLDADHNGGTAYDANDRQIVCGWGDAAPVEGAGRTITGVTFGKADPTGTTYVIEAKIPWSVEAFTPAANAAIGIDVHVDDDDDGGARDGKIIWTDGTDQAWTNPSLFGSGKLNGSGAPAAPTGLAATPGNAQISLSWTASTGATSYNVSRSTVSGSGYVSVATGITVTTYTNTGLTNGTTYYFVVSATNASGTSANSTQASATPNAGTGGLISINCAGPAASPFVADVDFSGGLTATNWTGTIDTSAVTSPAPQAVYQSERYGAMTYTIPGLTANTNYKVRLHMCENYFTATAQRVFNVTINGISELSSFDIYAAAGAAHKAVLREFTVAANSSGQEAIVFSNVVNNALINGIEVQNATAPVAPTGLAATAGNAQVSLSWTPSSGATSYNVLRSTVSGSGYAQVTNVTTTSYTNTGLTNGTAYYFVVQAVNAGGTSGNSAQASATPTAGSSPLSRAGWTSYSASTNQSTQANAWDGSLSTFWTTGTAQVYPQWFQIALGSAQTFSKIVVDAGNSTNYPVSWEAQKSTDGTTWTLLASGTGSGQVTTITFTATTANFVMIKQVGTGSANWNIAEINLYP